MSKNLINDMLSESSELLSQDKTIVEWFDPANKDHMTAYKAFLETKAWPVGVVPEGVALTPGWEGHLAKKIQETEVLPGLGLPEWAQKGIHDAVQSMESGEAEQMNMEQALDIVASHAYKANALDEWKKIRSKVAEELEKFGVVEGKVNEAGPTDDEQPGVPNKDFQPNADVGEEPAPDELEPEDEHDAVEADFDKIYLGQNDTSHFYVIAKKGDTGETEDLLITDQEGKELFSAKENDVDVHDVSKFILAALDSDKVNIMELERGVVLQYLVPQEEEEIEAEEDEEEEISPKEESEPKEEVPGKEAGVRTASQYRESKKLSETVSVKDNKGNTFSIQVIDEGSKDVVVQINNREFRFTPDFAALYEMDGGKLTEQGLQDLAQEVLGHLDDSEYAEVIGSGVQEDLDPSVTKEVGEDSLLQRVQQLRAKKDRTPDDDVTLRQLEDELKTRGQGATEGKVPSKDDDDAKIVKKLTERTTPREGDIVQVLNPDGNSVVIPHAKVLEIDTTEPDGGFTVRLEGEPEDEWYDNTSYQFKILEPAEESKVSEQYLDESEEFQSCASHGGRVRTVSGPNKEHGLKVGEYVHYCYLDDKSFRGEVKHKENESKISEKEGDRYHWKKALSGAFRAGLAQKAGKKPEDFDKEQLEAGTKVEIEHTNDQSKAQQIAMDHLTEDPHYYTKLKRMEAGKCGESKVNEKGWFYRAVDELKADEKFQQLVKEHGSESDEVHMYVVKQQGAGTSKPIIDDMVKHATGQVTEREYSDMAAGGQTKKVFQVEFVLDSGEKKSTRVMAFNDTEAKTMLKHQKGVKDVISVKPVAGRNESPVESRVSKARWCGRLDERKASGK